MSVYLKTLFIELQKLFNSKYTKRKRLKNFEQKRKKLLTVYNMKKSNNIHNETTEDTQHEILNTTNVQTNDADYECDSYNKQPFDENIDYSQHEEYLTGNVSYNDISIKQKQHKYLLPSIDLLDKCDIKQNYDKPELFKELSGELLKAMDEFGIKGEILKVKPGPIITVFEFKPAPGIKTSRIISLSEDIARSMSAISARISTIPGRNVLGIEIPNKERHTVHLYQLFSCDEFKSKINGIQLALGQDTNGNPVFADLTRMPHLLIAGTTGSGKSVSINDMILSILFKFKPNECKLIMIDPKMLELSVYDNIPHLLIPVVTEPKKAVSALKWAVTEMEQRYRNMAKLGVRNIDGFNKKLKDAIKNPDLLTKKVQIGFDSQTGRPTFEVQKLDFEPMPYIVIFVDEMADLMLVAGKEVETAIQRLAQMARAAGIHLIMATQRPSVDVITGTIKANFPTRISFQVSSKIDSRTILSEQGAEQLLGQGDMLYMSGVGRLLRVHAPFVQDTEIDRVVDFVKSQELPHYVDIQESETNNKLETEQLTIEQPVKRRRSQSH